MANEKKTIKTKLVQVGSEKVDMPFSLSELILDSTSGKTVKEQIADLQPKEDDTLTTGDKTIVGSINELKTDVNDLDTKVGTKADDTTSTPATGLFKYVDDNKTDIVDNYLGSKKLVYLTQAEYDLLSDSDKNDTTKVYNITDAVEKDYQEKEDNTLNTDDKTIVGGINELDTAIGDIKTEIGTKKVEGTPEVLEHYELSDSSNPDALEVVDDSVTPADGQITVTNANLNNSGTPFVAGNYVVHVDAIAEIPETPATGMYKHIDIEIKNALIGGEVDLSGYQTKSDADLETDDKTIIGAINALNTDSHMHIAYTQEEIEQLFDATPEEIQYYESLIQDQTVSVNRLFSSQEVVNRITQALLESQKYANDLVGGLSMVKAKKVETKPDTGVELTIYLVGNDTDGYHQWMFIEGAWADLGSTNITLDGYITTEKLTEELAKKADDDKVLKLDKVTTAMSSTPSNDNVLSELAVKNLLDGKADSTSIPTVTNDLTDDLKANYDSAYTHSQTTHFDGDYNNLTNKPTIPTVTTTIDSTSTDTQIPSAKAIYNMSGVKYFTEEEINSYGNSTFLSGVVNKTIAATVIPNAVDYYYLIKLPWDSQFNSQIWISACGRQDAYIRHTKIEGVWDTPKKICTTKVADVPVTDVEFTDSNVSKTGEFEICKYYVKNGYAYVTLNALTFNSSYTSGSPFATLPRPVFRYSISLSNAYNTVNLGKLFIEPNGEIHLYSNSIPTTELGFVTFSYPVAES